MQELWLVLELNPEPWRVGPVSGVRRGGKIGGYVAPDKQLVAYENAVREQVMQKLNWSEGDPLIFDCQVSLTLYLWRAMSEYATPQARTARNHEADATNMLKATEDALQKIVYKNDKDNRRVTSEIVEQSFTSVSRIIIHVETYTGLNPDEIPQSVWAQIDDTQSELQFYVG